MGIIDDYLAGDTAEPSAPVESKGLIQQYLDAEDGPKKVVIRTPKPPISGVTKAQSDEINSQPGIAPTPNTTPDFPNIGGVIADKVIGGLSEIGDGIKDVFTNKPATGVGKIGTGALSTLVAIPTGTGEFIDKVIGKPEGIASFGDKASLVLGGALPVKGAVGAVNKLPKNEAFRKLVEDIGPEQAGYVAKEMRSNPNLGPADLSPSVKQGTQRLFASVEGPHVDYLKGVTDHRLQSAASDLEQHMNANLGTVVDPVKKLDELKANIRAVGKEKISPALAGTKPVDTSSVVKFIDEIANPGINSKLDLETGLASTDITKELEYVKKYLTDGKSVRTDPDQLNSIQSALRASADKLLGSTDGASKRLGGILKQVRNKLVDAIDDASPKVDGKGTYRPALENYRDEFHIQDAFEHGHDAIMKNGKKLDDRPEFFEKWVKNSSDKEVEAAREGARIAYDTQMYAFKHAARRGTDIGDVEFNKRRMSALFGREEAEKMGKVFEDAKKVADTNNKLVQGSQSRIQNAQNTYFEPYDPKKSGSSAASTAVNVGLPLAGEAAAQFMGAPGFAGGAATGLALGALKVGAHYAGKAKTAIIKKVEAERNMSYAKMALPVEGPSREALIQQLEAVANRPPKQSMLVRAGSRANSLSRLVAP